MINAFEIDKSLAKAWGQLMIANKFQEAVQISMLAQQLANESGEGTLIGGARSMLQKALSELLDKEHRDSSNVPTNQISCTFCGKKETQVRLGAGASAFICNECVSKFSDALREPE